MSKSWPGTYEAPVSRLLKWGFFIWVFGFFSGITVIIIGYETTWWQQLALVVWNFHMANWWMFGIYGVFGTVTILAARYDHKKKVKKQQKAQRELLEKYVLTEKK